MSVLDTESEDLVQLISEIDEIIELFDIAYNYSNSAATVSNSWVAKSFEQYQQMMDSCNIEMKHIQHRFCEYREQLKQNLSTQGRFTY